MVEIPFKTTWVEIFMFLLIFTETPTKGPWRCRWLGPTSLVRDSSSWTSMLRWMKVLLERNWGITLFGFGQRPFPVLNHTLPPIINRHWISDKRQTSPTPYMFEHKRMCVVFRKTPAVIFKDQGFLRIKINLLYSLVNCCSFTAYFTQTFSHKLLEMMLWGYMTTTFQILSSLTVILLI